jgi:hypothetical protein
MPPPPLPTALVLIIKQFSEDDPYKYEHCGLDFTNQVMLRIHFKRVHQGKIFNKNLRQRVAPP